MVKKSVKGFEKVLEDAKSKFGDRIVQKDHKRKTEKTIISGTTVFSKKTTVLPPLPPPLRPLERLQTADIQSNSNSPVADAGEGKPPKTRVSELLSKFIENKPHLIELLLEHKFDNDLNKPCACGIGGATRTVRCNDCLAYPISCRECFLNHHRTMSTHWADIWDNERGYFTRHDISLLRPGGYSTHLGHFGAACPSPMSDQDLSLCLVDANGIHNTKVQFCGCANAPERYEQLMKVGLFPATLEYPKTAFTFNVLRHFHLLHLEGKISAYDFIGTLRRLTDNAFAQETSDPYPQFRTVIRVWRILQATKRLGQAHGIDDLLPHRPLGNLLVYCPACPEPHVNMEPNWEKTPPEFCHLNQMQHTIDGNFHANKYKKNTDPDDISLFEGRAYMPEDKKFREYLKSLPAGDVYEEQKHIACPLNAAKAKNRQKFKNTEISGVGNVQCGHIFVKSSVDLQLGERFANIDYALAHAIRQHCVLNGGRFDEKSFIAWCDQLASYDIACSYWTKILERFRKNFPDLVPAVERIRCLVPLVHIQNHQDNCTYRYSSAYTPNACHFHGETAEHVWPETNQLGPQIRQMNNGNRQDTLIDSYGDWNHKKMANMSATLYLALEKSKALFVQKREAFKKLCELYSDQIVEWNKLDRARRITGPDKEVHCVYRHNQKKVPSQSHIYDLLVAESSSSADRSALLLDSSVESDNAQCAAFLNEALLILSAQRKLRAKTASSPEDTAEITAHQDRLQHRIDKWRNSQKHIMPQVGDYVMKQSATGMYTNSPEHEVLYIPSDFTESERVALNLVTLGEYERRLHEGSAYDALRKVRTLVKTIGAFFSEKRAQAYGQDRHTRASSQIRDVEARRDQAMSEYSDIRERMIALGVSPNNRQFLPLTIADTYRKPTNVKRAVGDSRRADGPLWTDTGVTTGSRLVVPSLDVDADDYPIVGTQSSKAPKRKSSGIGKAAPKGRKRQLNEVEAVNADHDKVDGWLWSFKPGGNLSDRELEEWLAEGDRVQWFRAEAEMQRWQEEWEKTQADFQRCIRTFNTLSDVWKRLAVSKTDGAVAYARRKSDIFKSMELKARHLFERAGYAHLLPGNPSSGQSLLSDILQKERARPENIIPHVFAFKGI